MIRTIGLKAVAALAILMVCGTMAFAQGGRDTQTVKLAGTEWKGEEKLADFGPLTFQFVDGQRVVMIDAQSKVGGTYTQNGSAVRIVFANCVYEGTINGGVLSGRARGTDAQTSNFAWTWSVKHQAN